MGGALVTVAIYVAKQYGGVEVPNEVTAALTTLVGFLLAYVTPPGIGEVVE
jgi:hypothetical protein